MFAGDRLPARFLGDPLTPRRCFRKDKAAFRNRLLPPRRKTAPEGVTLRPYFYRNSNRMLYGKGLWRKFGRHRVPASQTGLRAAGNPRCPFTSIVRYGSTVWTCVVCIEV